MKEEPQPFGPGSQVWEDFGDLLVLSTTMGAFVLQVMHPAVSAGVDDFSAFRQDPFGRLVRSLDSVALWAYGGPAAVAEGRRLLEIHKAIKGFDAHGERYRALHPETYAWVHATAFVTAVVTAPLVRGREMTAAEEDALYAEMLQLGDLLRIPRRAMPATVPEYWEYYDAMVHDTLERTAMAEVVLDLARMPRLPLLPGPLQALAWPERRLLGHWTQLLVGGGMTPSARAKLGLSWSAAHDAELRALMSVARPVHARLPERLRYLPIAYHARRHARAVEGIHHRAALAAARPALAGT